LRGDMLKPCWPQDQPDAKSNLGGTHSRAARDKAT
jgi:hypothetical protein